MTTVAIPAPSRWRDRLARIRGLAGVALGATAYAFKKRATPAVRQVTEHFYSFAGFLCIDVAAFVHSAFTGWLVTGLMFLLLEFKVSEED